MEKMKYLEEMKDKFVDTLKCELDKGVESLDTKEAGEVVDIIKDLAETERNCWEAKYYEEIVYAMAEGGNESRAGYDNYRYRDGRFAPKGKGHYAGFQLPRLDDYHVYNPEFMDMMRMGYSEDNSNRRGPNNMVDNGSSNNGRGGYTDDIDRYGKAYKEYKEARRHYSVSHSSSDKDDMDHHANEHMMNTIATIREIYKNADPELKHRMKVDCEKLVEEMKD